MFFLRSNAIKMQKKLWAIIDLYYREEKHDKMLDSSFLILIVLVNFILFLFSICSIKGTY